MAVCPSCGANLVPPYRFCPSCGRAVPNSLPYPPASPPPGSYIPPKKDNTVVLVVVLVVVAVVVSIAAPAILYFMVSGLIGNGPGGPGPPISAIVSKSSNGSFWIVTFTSVQGGMTPTGTDLLLTTATSLAAVPPTPLSSLPGGNVTLQNSLGTLYIAFHGTAPGTVNVGDTILIAGATSKGASTTGYNLQITWSGSFFNTVLR